MSTQTVDSLQGSLMQSWQDPYPVYADLRRRGAVLRDADGTVLVTRFETIRDLLRNPAISSDPSVNRDYDPATTPGGATPEGEAAPFVELDPPEHTRLRHLVGQAFAARAATLAPGIRVVVDDLLDAADPTEFDAVADFTYQIPVAVMTEMLDTPRALRGDFTRWSHFISRSMDPSHPTDPDELQQVNSNLRQAISQLITQRTEHPGHDLISNLVMMNPISGESLSHPEIVGAILLLLVAGHETTTSLASATLHAALTDDDIGQRVRTDPTLVTPLVEEMGRLYPLTQFLYRYAAADLTVDGVDITVGDTVVLLVGGANRDPEAFDNPEIIDLNRNGPGHLSFGSGPHFCLGATLGRQMVVTAVTRLLERGRKPMMHTDRMVGAPSTLGGIRSLPVSFESLD